MKSISALAFVATLAAAPFSFAADTAQHKEHHTDTPVVKMAPNKTAKATTDSKAANEQMEKMNAQMKSMREMHEKMMAAKTPEERNALMADHMKSMQDGMSMMSGMKGGMMDGKASNTQIMSPQMMQKHMGTSINSIISVKLSQLSLFQNVK